MSGQNLNVANLERIRRTADSTIADAIETTARYVNQNVTQKPGTRVAPPVLGTRPVHPTP